MPFLGDMADELPPFLEPVPVEEDSEARIKGDGAVDCLCTFILVSYSSWVSTPPMRAVCSVCS